MDEGDKTGSGPISDDPLFILFAVTAALGDFGFLLGLLMGLAFLPFAGLGLIPLALALAFRQILGFCVVVYVWVAMKSPSSLIPPGANLEGVLASAEGAIGLLANPKIIMTSFWTLPLPILTLGLFLARKLQSEIYNKFIQQGLIIGLGVATGGAGFALEGTALAETAETASTIKSGIQTAQEIRRAGTAVGKTRRAASDIINAGSAEEEGGGSMEKQREDVFGLPEQNPLRQTQNELFDALPEAPPRPDGQVAERRAGNTAAPPKLLETLPKSTPEPEEEPVESEFEKTRRAKLQAQKDEEEKRRDLVLEDELGMSHREVERGLEQVEIKGDNTLDLRDAA